ncbi:MAG: Bax inhibitor-1/YccA family protein [Chloroflexi bacterium]|nr:Bax inhibitor-1/YccA family protein [Chloroflexota bacterium]
MSGFFGSGNQGPVAALRVEVRPLMRMVYTWMTVGLLITAIVALVIAGNPAIARSVQRGPVMFGAIIAELALVIGLSFFLTRLSPFVASLMFLLYAVLNGVTLSIIFAIYNIGTIQLAFFSAAGTFAAMTVLGYTTELDLSQYRSYLFMGLIGLLVAGLVNVFLRSSGLDLLISMAGVLIFTVLTAYDTQKIKRLASDPTIQEDGNLLMKISIMGALALYLDFVNLFLYLLRLFGRRR